MTYHLYKKILVAAAIINFFVIFDEWRKVLFNLPSFNLFLQCRIFEEKPTKVISVVLNIYFEPFGSWSLELWWMNEIMLYIECRWTCLLNWFEHENWTRTIFSNSFKREGTKQRDRSSTRLDTLKSSGLSEKEFGKYFSIFLCDKFCIMYILHIFGDLLKYKEK